MELHPDQAKLAKAFRSHKKDVVCPKCHEVGRFQRDGYKRSTPPGPKLNQRLSWRNSLPRYRQEEQQQHRNSRCRCLGINHRNDINRHNDINRRQDIDFRIPATVPPAPVELHVGGAPRRDFMEQSLLSDEHTIQTARDIRVELIPPLQKFGYDTVFCLRLDLFPLFLKSHAKATGINLYFESAYTTSRNA
ncbi:hypothetical protein BGX23_008447 [Mortierella sp. AD031]|nr:hypothetical protein BGX23_008447 [Mortierella sp. AD031]